MRTNTTNILRTALQQLEAERTHLDQQVKAVSAAIEALNGDALVGVSDGIHSTGRSGRRTMSIAARRAVSRRMKAYWAKRRAENDKTRRAAGRSNGTNGRRQSRLKAGRTVKAKR